MMHFLKSALLFCTLGIASVFAQGFIAPVTPGASGTSNRSVMLRDINQPGHGLSLGDFVRISATNIYTRAQANTLANAEIVGRVEQIVDGNNFKLNLGGYQTGLSGLVGGTTYYLSAATPGGWVAVAPTAFVRPVLYAINANEAYVLTRNVQFGTQENVTLGSLALTTTGLDVQTGTVAMRAGVDYPVIGITTAAFFPNTAFVRLTGATNQVLAGIAGGSNGRVITLVNAGITAASLLNQSPAAIATDRITTGLNGTLTVPVGGSTELRYDSTAGLWRVIGMYGVAGDVTGSLAAAVVSSIRGVGVTTTLPTIGQLLQFNGTQYVPATIAVADFCDIKQSVTNVDLNGWLVLNGRAFASMTATQQAQATACGFVGTLPNTNGRVLIDTLVNTTGGATTVSILQANIPSYNLSGGVHNHGITDPGHNHPVTMTFHNATGGGFNSGRVQLTDRTSQFTSNASEIGTSNATTGITINNSAALTIPSGGSGSALTLPSPPFYGVRFKIYLGV